MFFGKSVSPTSLTSPYCSMWSNDCLHLETENSLNQRPLHPDDCPAAIQMNWSNPGQFNWILKRSNSFSSASLSRPVRPIQPIYARPAEINRLKQSQQQQHQLNLSPASSSNSSELSSEESMDTSYRWVSKPLFTFFFLLTLQEYCPISPFNFNN